MVKIALLSKVYLPDVGGVQMVTHQLALHYAKLGHEVYIITGVPSNEGDEELKNICVRRLSLAIPLELTSHPLLSLMSHLEYNLKTFLLLVRLKPDHIHCQTPYSSLSAWLIHLMLHIPYSIGFHSEIKTHIGILLMPRFKKYWKKLPYLMSAKNLFVLSSDMWAELDEIGINSIIIPNGIDTAQYFPTGRNLLTFKSQPTVICVARLVRDKKIDDAILAINEVRKHFPQIKLVIVGSGNEKEHLESLVSSHCLVNNVVFTGKLIPTEVNQWYQSSHIFLQTSISEGFSMVSLEATACGLPIISTPVGVARDLISGTNAGYIVKLNNYHDVANNLCKLLSISVDEYSKMSFRCVNESKMYSWDKIAKQYLKEYGIEEHTSRRTE